MLGASIFLYVLQSRGEANRLSFRRNHKCQISVQLNIIKLCVLIFKVQVFLLSLTPDCRTRPLYLASHLMKISKAIVTLKYSMVEIVLSYRWQFLTRGCGVRLGAGCPTQTLGFRGKAPCAGLRSYLELNIMWNHIPSK
jgi:hypothetical protein